MKKTLLLSVLLALTVTTLHAQMIKFAQYFDGADTSASNSIIVHLDTAAENIWQIGRPQKTIFDTANTTPNVLVTDTVNNYPKSNTSIFTFGLNVNNWSPIGIAAIRWVQKLDMSDSIHGGMVEFSLDTGITWRNTFTDPLVYNFYGFKNTNVDTLAGGVQRFSGKDTVWRDIWLCFRTSNLPASTDSILFRFTFTSDTTDNNNEGWMIDNLLAQETFFHTVSNTDPNQAFMVYPTLTDGIVKIESDKDAGDIENIVVTDMNGRTVLRQDVHGRKTTLNIGHMPAGNYFIGIHTLKKIEVYRITLQH